MLEPLAEPHRYDGLVSRTPLPTKPHRRRWRSTPPEITLQPEALLRGLTLALPAVIAAVVCSYLLFDEDVARWAHHAPRELSEWAGRISDLAHGTPLVVIAVVLGLIAALARKWALVSNALLLIFALAATGGVNVLLKMILGRARPTNQVNEDDIWTGAGHDGFYFFEVGYKLMGFPSGHSAAAGAVAAVGLMIRPTLWPLWLVFAALIPATRVLSNAHYVSDTIAGVWVGAACAAGVALWVKKFNARYADA